MARRVARTSQQTQTHFPTRSASAQTNRVGTSSVATQAEDEELVDKIEHVVAKTLARDFPSLLDQYMAGALRDRLFFREEAGGEESSGARGSAGFCEFLGGQGASGVSGCDAARGGPVAGSEQVEVVEEEKVAHSVNVSPYFLEQRRAADEEYSKYVEHFAHLDRIFVQAVEDGDEMLQAAVQSRQFRLSVAFDREEDWASLAAQPIESEASSPTKLQTSSDLAVSA